ncbi:MAG: hypothetical protein IT460_03870 [Planctomycetes bacterium]|nr:hypothetical protein [Planctomycetota bacterium]
MAPDLPPHDPLDDDADRDALEARLRAEPLWPLPVALVGRVTAALRAAGPAPWERPASEPALRLPRALRVAAAAVLVAAAGATAIGGIEPVSATAATVASAPVPEAVRDAWPVPPASLRAVSSPAVPTARDALVAGADAVPGGTGSLVVVGALALLTATWLGARRRRALGGR